MNIFTEKFTTNAATQYSSTKYPSQRLISLFLSLGNFFLEKNSKNDIARRSISFSISYLSCYSLQSLSFPVIGSWRVAQSGGITCGKDQSTGQLGLRLWRILILFEDNRTGISRLCAIAKDPASVAVLLEPVRTRAPNHQRIRAIRRLYGYLQRKRPTNLHRKNCRLLLQGLRRALTRDKRFSAGMRPVLRN